MCVCECWCVGAESLKIGGMDFDTLMWSLLCESGVGCVMLFSM